MVSKKEPSVSKKMLAAEQSEKNQPAHPVLVLVAGFVSAVLLFFCCACGSAMWWFRPEISENPDRARQLVTEMVDIQIPDSYQPKGTIEMNVAYIMSVRGAYYERFVGDGLLTLIEVSSRFQAEGDIREHFRQTLIEKGGGGTPLVIDEADSRRIGIEINGELVSFQFDIGRDPPSGRTFHIVEGVFAGKQGEVLLAMRVHEDNWEESSILDMLQTIGDLPIEMGPPVTLPATTF